MITQSNYKGFNIYELADGRFYSQDKGDVSFKSEGYATLNAAKVAITKYLTQRDKEYEEIKAQREKQKPMSLGDILRMKIDQIEAEKMTVYPKSRNKREGRFTGKVDGLIGRSINWPKNKGPVSIGATPRNRKDRKAIAIHDKHYCEFGA